MSNRDGEYDVYAMDPDGTDLVHYDRPGDQEGPAISPDGNRIAYYTSDEDGEGSQGIYVMNVGRTGRDAKVLDSQTLWRDHPVDWFGPEWSPDGTRLAVTGYVFDHRETVFDYGETYEYDVYQYDVFTVRIDGTDLTNVTNTAYGNESGSSWSRDGRIAFASFASKANAHIYAVNADGTGLTKLTNTSHWLEGGLAYSPDDSKIAFHGGYWDAQSGNEATGLFTMPSGGGEPTLVPVPLTCSIRVRFPGPLMARS